MLEARASTKRRQARSQPCDSETRRKSPVTRHGRRSLLGTFGQVRVEVPRAALPSVDCRLQISAANTRRARWGDGQVIIIITIFSAFVLSRGSIGVTASRLQRSVSLPFSRFDPARHDYRPSHVLHLRNNLSFCESAAIFLSAGGRVLPRFPSEGAEMTRRIHR